MWTTGNGERGRRARTRPMGWSKLLCGRPGAGVYVRRQAMVRQQQAQKAELRSCLFTWCGELLVYRPPIQTSGPGFLSAPPPLIARLRPGLPQPPVNLVSWGPSSGRKLPPSKARLANLSKELSWRELKAPHRVIREAASIVSPPLAGPGSANHLNSGRRIGVIFSLPREHTWSENHGLVYRNRQHQSSTAAAAPNGHFSIVSV
ncbi:hypothetical protein QBC34DRAFT_205247 [Podospora aff. communis PSN243]|uniref:Uncharacterized protein n=1 Tax=Podospora aff. communis PSN243 TaxID=3040156 RepID=A0AAV9GY59_9PEZI|nr:hypothetical protein QBC34DRAFT_205247 [Podospora aff. communis PSN243]